LSKTLGIEFEIRPYSNKAFENKFVHILEKQPIRTVLNCTYQITAV